MSELGDVNIFRVDKDSWEVYMYEKKLDLIRVEYEIFLFFISKKGYVFSCESIVIESESINFESFNKSIDVIIGCLWFKIEKNFK